MGWRCYDDNAISLIPLQYCLQCNSSRVDSSPSIYRTTFVVRHFPIGSDIQRVLAPQRVVCQIHTHISYRTIRTIASVFLCLCACCARVFHTYISHRAVGAPLLNAPQSLQSSLFRSTGAKTTARSHAHGQTKLIVMDGLHHIHIYREN